MRTFIFILAISMFIGCSSKKDIILYSDYRVKSSKSISGSIGVREIELPQYLLTKKIPFLKDGKQVDYLDDQFWVTYLDEQLTTRLISTLQRAFNTPKVYRYPFNTSKKPSTILRVIVNRFIANGNEVILEATWKKDRDDGKLFLIRVPISSKNDIIDGMNKAFLELEKDIVDRL